MNNRVLLNDGRQGDIVLIHNNAVSRPLIKLTDGTFVDLEKENRNVLFIESLI